jgi:hypothetical protein
MCLIVFSDRLKVKFDMLDDGDDCLMLFEYDDWISIESRVQEEFLDLGMEIKVEAVAQEIENADFCQSNPIYLGDLGWKYVRNWQKVVSFGLSGISKSFKNPYSRPALVNTIGMGELILNYGVPILQEYALSLMRNAGTSKVIDDPDSGLIIRVNRELKAFNLKKLTKIDPAPITSEARMSFWKAFGVNPTEQQRIEDELREWVFDPINCGQDVIGIDENETYLGYSALFTREHNFW